jgi:hypothetical protein
MEIAPPIKPAPGFCVQFSRPSDSVKPAAEAGMKQAWVSLPGYATRSVLLR